MATFKPILILLAFGGLSFGDIVLERRLEALERRVNCLEEPIWQLGPGGFTSPAWTRCSEVESCACSGDLKTVDCSGDSRKPDWPRMVVPVDVEQMDLSQRDIPNVSGTLLRGLKKLKELNMNKVGLVYIPKYFFYHSENLLHLKMSGNKLKELDEEMLQNCPELRTLDLSENSIDILPSALLAHNPKLNLLDVSMNRLSVFFAAHTENLPKLRILDVSWNNLFSLELSGPKTGNCSLEMVSAGRNAITMLKAGPGLKECNSLTEMDLSFNKMEALPNKFSADFTHLKKLDLSKNTLERFEASSIPSTLEHLDLSRNLISTLIPLHISSFPPHSSFALQRIDLSSNMVSVLAPGYFKPFSGLKQLVLMDNVLTEASMRDLPASLEEIKLNSNHLTRLSDFSHLSHLPNLSSTVDLQHNLWLCDCALLPFVNWISAHTHVVSGLGLLCDAPADMESRDIMDTVHLDC